MVCSVDDADGWDGAELVFAAGAFVVGLAATDAAVGNETLDAGDGMIDSAVGIKCDGARVTGAKGLNQSIRNKVISKPSASVGANDMSCMPLSAI